MTSLPEAGRGRTAGAPARDPGRTPPMLPPDGRFAPSPTGTLHLGNLRTALLAWLFARSQDARFLVRMEDLDTGRVRERFYDEQVRDLARARTRLGRPGRPPVRPSRPLRRRDRDARGAGPRLRVLVHPGRDPRGRLGPARRPARGLLPRHVPAIDRRRAGRAARRGPAAGAARPRRRRERHVRGRGRGDRDRRRGRLRRAPQRRRLRVQPGRRRRRRGARASARSCAAPTCSTRRRASSGSVSASASRRPATRTSR